MKVLEGCHVEAVAVAAVPLTSAPNAWCARGFWRRSSPINSLLSSKIGHETTSAVSFAARTSAGLHRIPLHRGSQKAETGPAVNGAAPLGSSAAPAAPERQQEAAMAHTWPRLGRRCLGRFTEDGPEVCGAAAPAPTAGLNLLTWAVRSASLLGEQS